MRFRGGLTTVVALGAVGTAAIPPIPAIAATSNCTRVHVEAAPELSAAWRDATRELVDAIGDLSNRDCAATTLFIAPRGAGAIVVAVTPTGERGERSLDRPAALVPIALALVASVPPDDDREEPPRPSPSESTSPRVPPAPLAREGPPAISPRRDEPAVGALLGGGAGLRFGEPTSVAMLDFEARVDVIVRRWVLLVSFRYAPFALSNRLDNATDSYDELAIGLGAGRRVAIGRGWLDFALSPELVSMTLDRDAPGSAHGGSHEQFRFDGSARWSLPLNQALDYTLSLDSDVSPHALRHAHRAEPDLPPFPAWTLGLRFGVVGTLL